MKQSWNELQRERERLPIFSAKHRLLKELSQLDNAIVIGETGSGKTTQIPQVFLISQPDTNCIYSIVMIYNVSPHIFGKKRENKMVIEKSLCFQYICRAALHRKRMIACTQVAFLEISIFSSNRQK